DTSDKKIAVSVGSITPENATGTVASIGLNIPVLAGYDYLAEVSLDGQARPEEYVFAGITEDRYITLTGNKLGFDGFDADAHTNRTYNIQILDSDGNQVVVGGTPVNGNISDLTTWTPSVASTHKVITGFTPVQGEEYYVLIYRASDNQLINAAKVEVK